MQSAAGTLQQRQQQPRIQPALNWTLLDALHAALPPALISNPRHLWRGFFVAFSYWFGFYFYGYRQTPARAGARTMLE
jgi:hypothetical protein